MAKTETQMKSTMNAFENFTSASGDAARKSFERSVALMGEMGEFNKANMAAMAESAQVAGKAIENMSTRAASYAKTSMEQVMEVGRSVSTAKSVKEAMEIQADFAKSAFDRYLEELNAWTGLMASSMKDCMEPLNSQAGEFVAMMQRRV